VQVAILLSEPDRDFAGGEFVSGLERWAYMGFAVLDLDAAPSRTGSGRRCLLASSHDERNQKSCCCF
jgi:hypothetical protein